MSIPSYRVYTKRKLVNDPDLEKGYTKKTKRQREIDQDETLRAKFISKDECKLLDNVLDENQVYDNGNTFSFTIFNIRL